MKKNVKNATTIATENATENATTIATENATENATTIATENATENATTIATENATENATTIATENATENATTIATEMPEKVKTALDAFNTACANVRAEIEKFNAKPANERIADDAAAELKKAEKLCKASAIDLAKEVCISNGASGVVALAKMRFAAYTSYVVKDSIASEIERTTPVKMCSFSGADLMGMGIDSKWGAYLAALYIEKAGKSASDFGMGASYAKELKSAIAKKFGKKGAYQGYDTLSKTKKKVVLTTITEAICGKPATSDNVRYLDAAFLTRVKPNTIKAAGLAEMQEILLDIIGQIAHNQTVTFYVRGVKIDK